MRRLISWLALVAGLSLAAGCAPQPAYAPTPTKTPDPAYLLAEATATEQALPSTLTPLPSPAAPTDAPTPTATAVATDTETPAPTATVEQSAAPATDQATATEDASLPADHYWLIRPIPAGYRDYADRTYAYGMTAGGKLRPHTAWDMPNPQGTPVVAVADATVYYAGDDSQTQFGPEPNFYGNLIVLQLSGLTYNGRPIFTLYGHLSKVLVQTGQPVAKGDKIGEVGGTGIANGGTHLHFEVRLDDPMNYFTSTRNPDLWVEPYAGFGTLAGRITDASGNMLREVAITITSDKSTRYTWTYAGDENIPDDAWHENWTYGDLPEGWYAITASSGSKIYRARVYVHAGQTAWLDWVFD